MDCDHSLVDKGVCRQCGLEFSFFPDHISSSVTTAGGSNTTLVPEIMVLDMPNEIKDKAKEIYFRIETKTRKGKKRKLLLFFCIYNAHVETGKVCDPRLLVKKLGLSIGDATRSLSLFSKAQTGFISSNVNVSPLELIPEYMDKIALDRKHLSDVLSLGEDLLRVDNSLLDHFPQKVAAGILLLYLQSNDMPFVKKHYAKSLELSEVTISNILRHLTPKYKLLPLKVGNQ